MFEILVKTERSRGGYWTPSFSCELRHSSYTGRTHSSHKMIQSLHRAHKHHTGFSFEAHSSTDVSLAPGVQCSKKGTHSSLWWQHMMSSALRTRDWILNLPFSWTEKTRVHSHIRWGRTSLMPETEWGKTSTERRLMLRPYQINYLFLGQTRQK